MYRLCHIAHKGFDVGHGGGAVLGKELDDGAADDGTIADFNALNRKSQWVEEKNLNFSAVLHPGAKMPIMNTEAKPRGAFDTFGAVKDKRRTPCPEFCLRRWPEAPARFHPCRAWRGGFCCRRGYPRDPEAAEPSWLKKADDELL